MHVEAADVYREWLDALKDRAARGTRLLLLLAGGDKSSQQKDIATAIQLARNFQE